MTLRLSQWFYQRFLAHSSNSWSQVSCNYRKSAFKNEKKIEKEGICMLDSRPIGTAGKGSSWMKRWTFSARLLFLFLSLDRFLADKKLLESERRMRAFAKFQSLWLFLAVLQWRERKNGKERERERGTSQLKRAKITRCILSKTWLLPLCHWVLKDRQSYHGALARWIWWGTIKLHHPRAPSYYCMPSSVAISTSDIQWPPYAFFPVKCHGDERVRDSSLCLHTVVYTIWDQAEQRSSEKILLEQRNSNAARLLWR